MNPSTPKKVTAQSWACIVKNLLISQGLSACCCRRMKASAKLAGSIFHLSNFIDGVGNRRGQRLQFEPSPSHADGLLRLRNILKFN
jgi:hypothetical protein